MPKPYPCTCGPCRFPSLFPQFAGCIQQGWIRAWLAIANGEATEIMRIVRADGSFLRWTPG